MNNEANEGLFINLESQKNESLKIPRENVENHENLRIPFENSENHENQ